jgi:hypothetical protein
MSTPQRRISLKARPPRPTGDGIHLREPAALTARVQHAKGNPRGPRHERQRRRKPAS